MPSYLGRRLTLGCRRYLRLATPWPSLPPSRRPDSRRLGSDLISSDADLTEARETLGAIPLALAMRRCSFYTQSDAVFAGRLWMLCLTLRWPSLTPRASLQKEFSTKRNEDPGPDAGHTDQILEYRGSCPMYQILGPRRRQDIWTSPAPQICRRVLASYSRICRPALDEQMVSKCRLFLG